MTPEQLSRASQYASIPDEVWILLRDDLWVLAATMEPAERYGIARAITYVENYRSAQRREKRRGARTTTRKV